jgi:hypothetical protein
MWITLGYLSTFWRWNTEIWVKERATRLCLDEQCLFYKVDTSQDCGVHDICNEPFISPGATEQIFFAQDRFDEGWWFVLQHRPYRFNVFELLEPDTYNDGRHVEGLHSGQEPEAVTELDNNEEHGFQERESEVLEEENMDDDDEDSETLGGAPIDLDDDFNMTFGNMQQIMLNEQEDSDYETRRTRYMFLCF